MSNGEKIRLINKLLPGVMCLVAIIIISCGILTPELGEWYCLGLECEDVISIAVDPMNTDIIYVGTSFDYSEGVNGKLFKSTDSGETWDTLLTGGNYNDILIDPTNSNIVYATPFGLMKSEDAGGTWQSIVDGITLDWETRIQGLAINPQNPEVLYVGTGGFWGGLLYKSHNGGLTWNEISPDSLNGGVMSIAVDPVDTNIVYVGTSWECSVWKSNDAGRTWLSAGLTGGTLIHDILIDPKDSSTVYVCSETVWKTEDGGKNWVDMGNGIPESSNVIKIIQGSSSQLFLVATYGDDGGIYEYIETEDKWDRIGIDSLNVSYYYSDLKFYSNPDRLYYGGDGGLYIQYLCQDD